MLYCLKGNDNKFLLENHPSEKMGIHKKESRGAGLTSVKMGIHKRQGKWASTKGKAVGIHQHRWAST
jgi:hypothetical protein